MSIHKNHPTSLAFKKNEVDTLEVIYTRKLLKNFTDLETKIHYTYFNFKDKSRLNTIDFAFHADFDMTVERKVHKIIIGAVISGDYNIASYFLAICGKDKSLNLIRKFHFDYAHPRISTKQPVPIFHMQYGGKLSSEMAKLGISDKKIDPWLSLPRLNYPPINLALLLDVTFCEFRTKETEDVIENPDWKNLIKKNEELLVRPYHSSINDFASSGNYNSTHLIRDFCYGR